MSSHLLSCAPINSCALPPAHIHYHSLSITSDRVHEFTSALVRSYQLLCAPINTHPLSFTLNNFRPRTLSSALVRSHLLSWPLNVSRPSALFSALVHSHQLLCIMDDLDLVHSRALQPTPIHYHSLSIASDRVHEFTSPLVRSYQLLCAPTNSYPLSFTLNSFRPCARVHICSRALLSTLVRSHQLLSTIIHSQ